MKYKLAETPEGLWHYVHDIPEPEAPLLDEIEFTQLCNDLIEAFGRDGGPYTVYDVETATLEPCDAPTVREGCFTAILGPSGVFGFPTWRDGRYDMLTIREARMLAEILVERLGLVWEPDLKAHSWAEVATSRFLVSSRGEFFTPGPYPAKGPP